MSREWEQLREEFAKVAFEHGISNAARMVPMSRRNAYNVLNGQTQHPSQAVAAGIERMVKECKGAQSPRSED